MPGAVWQPLSPLIENDCPDSQEYSRKLNTEQIVQGEQSSNLKNPNTQT